MARRRKQNPEGGATGLIVIAGVAAAGYFAYINNWLSSIGLPYGTTTPATPSTGTGTGTSSAGGAGGGVLPTQQVTAAPPQPPPPPLGTVVSNTMDLAAQATANLPYLLPNSSAIGQAPAGYTLAVDQTASETGTSQGQFYLRNDIANAVIAVTNVTMAALNNVMAARNPDYPPYIPITLDTLYQFPVQNIAQIQTIMTSKGLSGMGFTRSRSVFPYNPIMAGVDIINAPRQGWN